MTNKLRGEGVQVIFPPPCIVVVVCSLIQARTHVQVITKSPKRGFGAATVSCVPEIISH